VGPFRANWRSALRITGRRLREDLCLEAAEAIEARLGVATPIDPVR